MNSVGGGLLTCIILIVTLAYAAVKFVQLMGKHNPNVSEVWERNIHDSNDRLSLNAINFKMAFSVEGYHVREMKNDPRYVKYLVRIFGIHEGKEYEKFIPYHKCTEADWAEFAPPAKSAIDGWTAIKSDPKRGMYCLDLTEDIDLYGNEKNDEY